MRSISLDKFKVFSYLSIATTLAAGFLLNSIASATVPGTNSIVNLTSSGAQLNNSTSFPRNGNGQTEISGNGQYVLFNTFATGVTSNDTNGTDNIYVRDTVNGTTTLVTADSSGDDQNSYSGYGAISYDGQYVAFDSQATNLVSGDDESGISEAYLHNMQTGENTLVSDTASGTYANQNSTVEAVSADGRYVLFYSNATNLVSSVTSDSYFETYLKDTQTGALLLVSQNSSGDPANNNVYDATMSCDGNVIAFSSYATNLVSDDTNGYGDVFLYQPTWSGNTISDVTLSGNGSSSEPVVSCNGNDIAYQTYATNLATGLSGSGPNVLEYDRLGQTNTLVDQSTSGTLGNQGGDNPSISDDGRYVTFTSDSTNLASNATTNRYGDIFIRDTKADTTQLISESTSGTNAGYSDESNISANGSYVAYISQATNLVSGTDNGYRNVFISATGF